MTAPTSPASGALPALPSPDLWIDGGSIKGYCTRPGPGPWFTAQDMRDYARAALASREATEPTEAQKQQVIADFLERTGQYVTNDASRDAAIKSAVEAALASPKVAPALTDEQIRTVFFANGFTIKEGQVDLKPYVFKAARALLALAAPAPVAPTDEREVLRAEQAAAVMSRIGPLLDAWEGLDNDTACLIRDEAPDLLKAVAAINRAMEDGAPVAPTPAQPSEDARPAYPEGDVVGPCVCGSWPGGPCLRCPWTPATLPSEPEGESAK